MRDADDIRTVYGRSGGGALPFQRHMADPAIGVVTPFAMTGDALPMEGAFQSRLTQIGGLSLLPVALAAGRDMPFGAVMVTGGATLIHSSHLGVKLMVEMDGAVLIDQFVQDEHLRGFRQIVPAGDVDLGHPGTVGQAGILGRRCLTGMALTAVDFGHFSGRQVGGRAERDGQADDDSDDG